MSTTAFTHSASSPALTRRRVTGTLLALVAVGLIALVLALASSSSTRTSPVSGAPAAAPALMGATSVPNGFYRDPTTHQLVAIPSLAASTPSAVTAQRALTAHAGM